jgi:hypothetical protein
LSVVLSPAAAQSVWVNNEVAYWLQHRGHQQLMMMLASGRLHWDRDRACFDPALSDAALPILTQPGTLPVEPFFIDVSADEPWDLRAPVFREKVTALAARSTASRRISWPATTRVSRNASAACGRRPLPGWSC